VAGESENLLLTSVQVDAHEVEAACNLFNLISTIKAESAAVMTEILAPDEPEEPPLFALVRPFDGGAGAAGLGSPPGPQPPPPLVCAQNTL